MPKKRQSEKTASYSKTNNNGNIEKALIENFVGLQ